MMRFLSRRNFFFYYVIIWRVFAIFLNILFILSLMILRGIVKWGFYYQPIIGKYSTNWLVIFFQNLDLYFENNILQNNITRKFKGSFFLLICFEFQHGLVWGFKFTGLIFFISFHFLRNLLCFNKGFIIIKMSQLSSTFWSQFIYFFSRRRR